MPKRSRTAARLRNINVRTSFADAPPVLTITLACLRLISAPPIASPLSPQASINLPA